MITRAWHMRYTILFGMIVGLFVSPMLGDIVTSKAWEWYDRAYPVVDFKGELVAREAAAVIVKIEGRKLRDCIYVDKSLQSYRIDVNDVLADAFEQKLDPVTLADSKTVSASSPVGYVSLGTWRVWPVLDKTRNIVMYVKHLCGTHQVVSKIADVKVD